MLAYLRAAALLLLATRSAAQILTVAVDNVTVGLTDSMSTQGERLTISSKVHSLALTCRVNSTTNLTQSGSLTWAWRKASAYANTSISDSRLPISSQIDASGLTASSVLTIKYPVKSDVTTYLCTVNGTYNATGGFISAPLLTMTVNGVNEYDTSPWPGENLAITCLVEGYPIGNVQWTKSVEPTFSVTNNNTIYMNSISYNTDRGYITCTSTNAQGTNSATMFLRIKSPTSYLAPLVATIVELVIMALVCGAYELYDRKKRRTLVGDGEKTD